MLNKYAVGRNYIVQERIHWPALLDAVTNIKLFSPLNLSLLHFLCSEVFNTSGCHNIELSCFHVGNLRCCHVKEWPNRGPTTILVQMECIKWEQEEAYLHVTAYLVSGVQWEK
jgi:hypothetical protein